MRKTLFFGGLLAAAFVLLAQTPRTDVSTLHESETHD